MLTSIFGKKKLKRQKICQKQCILEKKMIIAFGFSIKHLFYVKLFLRKKQFCTVVESVNAWKKHLSWLWLGKAQIGALTCIFIIILMLWSFWNVSNYDNKQHILEHYMGHAFIWFGFGVLCQNHLSLSNQINYYFLTNDA